MKPVESSIFVFQLEGMYMDNHMKLSLARSLELKFHDFIFLQHLPMEPNLKVGLKNGHPRRSQLCQLFCSWFNRQRSLHGTGWFRPGIKGHWPFEAISNWETQNCLLVAFYPVIRREMKCRVEKNKEKNPGVAHSSPMTFQKAD